MKALFKYIRQPSFRENRSTAKRTKIALKSEYGMKVNSQREVKLMKLIEKNPLTIYYQMSNSFTSDF